MTADGGATSDDAALGGRLVLRQPLRGHRFGHDAILLAAATPAQAGEQAVEFGAGVGAAGLALARRVDGVAVTLIEIDPALTALATDNAARNGLDGRVRAVCLDVTAPAAAFAAAGLKSGSAHHVLMNAPFNAPHNSPPDHDRRRARTALPGTLALWLRAAARLLASRGTVTLIWRADALSEVFAALGAEFGAIAVVPVFPRPDAPAIRVLLRAVKGSKAPSALLPGLVLTETTGKPTATAEAVLRDGIALKFDER